MAKDTANNTESMLVPIVLCKFFNCAVQARRRVEAWFEARAVQEAPSSFIIVLNDAFRLPRPMISSGLQAARIGGKRFASEALGMENKFACLSLRDVAELADDEAGAVREEAVSSTSGAQEASGQC
jgi:hypothetical protein